MDIIESIKNIFDKVKSKPLEILVIFMVAFPIVISAFSYLFDLILTLKELSATNSAVSFILSFILLIILFVFLLEFLLLLPFSNNKTARRFAYLLVFFFISVWLVFLITYSQDYIICNLFYINCYLETTNETRNILYRGLLYSIPPLPVLFILWVFRHTDTQENLHQNALFEAQSKMLKPSAPHKAVAMQQLKILLKKVPRYQEQILLTLEEGMRKLAWGETPKKTKTFNLKDFNLMKRDFSHAVLNHENLQEKNLRKIDLQGASLIKSNLQHANLYRADLRGANLEYTGLQRADLQNADFRSAKLLMTDFRNADLRGATLRKYSDSEAFNDELIPQNKKLKWCIYNDGTIFPDGRKGENYRDDVEKDYKAMHEGDLSGKEMEQFDAIYDPRYSEIIDSEE